MTKTARWGGWVDPAWRAKEDEKAKKKRPKYEWKLSADPLSASSSLFSDELVKTVVEDTLTKSSIYSGWTSTTLTSSTPLKISGTYTPSGTWATSWPLGVSFWKKEELDLLQEAICEAILREHRLT